MDIKLLTLSITLFSITACDPDNNRPDSIPATDNTVIIERITISPANQIINSDLPGCVDAIELINQSITIPSFDLSFDVDGIIDRVSTVVPTATFSFSVRPVDPITCSPTTLPGIPSPTITLGFNYLADITRNAAICVNASSIVFTQFNVTGTPLDALVEEQAKQTTWNTMDSTIVSRLQPLMGSGARPAGTPARCSNWIDIAEL